MCSRYSATKQKVTFYVNGSQISFALGPRYNIAPIRVGSSTVLGGSLTFNVSDLAFCTDKIFPRSVGGAC
jgi:hypothetical protein